MAITSTFDPATGVLSTFGDDNDNAVTTSRNAAGAILVNGGAVPIAGGTPTVANTSLISVSGQGGNDTIALDESSGALPAAQIFGGDGTDTAEVNGGNGAEVFTVTANGTRVRFDRVSPAPFSLDIGTTETLVVNMNGGDDTFSASGNLAPLISLRVDGGAGNDTILGGNGADVLIGGDDNDFVDGNQGNDTALLGAGDDVFQWDPGDGSDVVEGQAGLDGLIFNGANVNETIDISANGGRVRLTRDIGNIVMDLDDVEGIKVEARGGVDKIVINDVSGTDLTSAGVTVDLESAPGSGVGDGQVDTVTVNATAGNDAITVNTLSNGAISVTGTPASVRVFHAEATDQPVVNGGSGNDTIDASALPAGRIALTLDGGAGNDTIRGSAGNDVLLGGDDDDTLTGGPGDDQVFGGVGNDRMVWNTGDGSDLVEGGDGTDTAEVNGGNGAEVFTVTANGTRVRFDRVSPAPFSLDIGTTETLVVNMNGGDDTFSASGNLAPLISLRVDGGAGNDTILGGNGADVLLGGDGNDFVDGNQGNDTALLGTGDDIFQWDPGDGSDVVEGQAGLDGLIFNGANVNENIDISANGGRVRLTRDIGNIVMDLDDVEGIKVEARGGVDKIVINDVSGTDLTSAGVTVDLGSAPGSGVGDGQVDTVTVNATAGNDAITVNTLSNGAISVTGTPASVRVFHAEATDQLVVNGGDGDDRVDASALAAGLVALTIDAGASNDVLIGSAGADILLAGDGNDTVTGGPGDDLALLGAGIDVFF